MHIWYVCVKLEDKEEVIRVFLTKRRAEGFLYKQLMFYSDRHGYDSVRDLCSRFATTFEEVSKSGFFEVDGNTFILGTQGFKDDEVQAFLRHNGFSSNLMNPDSLDNSLVNNASLD